MILVFFILTHFGVGGCSYTRVGMRVVRPLKSSTTEGVLQEKGLIGGDTFQKGFHDSDEMTCQDHAI